jgi:AcrR family transcriptional regulator
MKEASRMSGSEGDRTSKGRRTKPAKKGNPAGRPTLDELERRKTKVMKVATDLFIREGYAATSLVDIAKQAGVATRTLYQHFGDKEAMFQSVMYARDSAAVFAPPEVTDDDSIFDVMMKVADYAHEVNYRPTTIDLMRLAISESKRFPTMMKRLMEQSNRRFKANVKHEIDELVARRMVQDDNTAEAAEMFIHLVIGNTPVMVYGGWESPPTNRKMLEDKVDLFINGRWGAVVAKRAKLPQRGKPGRTAPAAVSGAEKVAARRAGRA